MNVSVLTILQPSPFPCEMSCIPYGWLLADPSFPSFPTPPLLSSFLPFSLGFHRPQAAGRQGPLESGRGRAPDHLPRYVCFSSLSPSPLSLLLSLLRVDGFSLLPLALFNLPCRSICITTHPPLPSSLVHPLSKKATSSSVSLTRCGWASAWPKGRPRIVTPWCTHSRALSFPGWRKEGPEEEEARRQEGGQQHWGSARAEGPSKNEMWGGGKWVGARCGKAKGKFVKETRERRKKEGI